MPKTQTTNQEAEEQMNQINSTLVGYVRKSNAGGALKLSVNASAFSDCKTYVTSDGQAYVPLVISLNSLSKILSGERAVTTISQLAD